MSANTRSCPVVEIIRSKIFAPTAIVEVGLSISVLVCEDLASPMRCDKRGGIQIRRQDLLLFQFVLSGGGLR